jgi:hypothetical protein
MHGALRACHPLAMYFAMFAVSDVEAFDPIIELEQVKREISGLEDEGVRIVGDWVNGRDHFKRRRDPKHVARHLHL